MTYNAYGLSREIPSDIKRTVRQRCGFGCVICGMGIVQYEHVDPEFKDARTHEPDGIALLCPQCHAKVTTRMWSKARVKLAMKSPKCKQVGFAREFFDFVDGHPSLQFGGLLLSNCPIPIQVQGNSLFSIKPPEVSDGPFLFSGLFTDSLGNITLVIEDNEWKAFSSSWDVEVKGPKITIREAKRIIHLILRAEQPSTIFVEKLNMSLGGYKFEANKEQLTIIDSKGNKLNIGSSIFDNCRVGLSI
ncbi:HNH endonuclease [Pseudomonas luteola]|uniref:HNH endonuclease n=1 Tax=Pseudomonas luteola TaxID=47886 RepID=UPI00123B80CC|nr:HNH endonuclease signature motif containing protein [Pseudomonas luteola]QEU31503.1 HNH endonuclease [Pseudomonas luteola]